MDPAASLGNDQTFRPQRCEWAFVKEGVIEKVPGNCKNEDDEDEDSELAAATGCLRGAALGVVGCPGFDSFCRRVS